MRTGYAPSSVSNWLTGRSLPTADRLGDLLIALEASAEEQRAFATARDAIEEGRRAPGPPAPASDTPPAPVPHELPADVAAFTGRTAELATLDRMLAGAGRPGIGEAPAPVVISAVSGTAGVGKTALAIHWALRAAACFPDGQLYINLRGYGPDQPVPPGDALARFLRALGWPDQDIPPETEEREARYRSLVHGKRMLIMLDNAASVDQVRPLLPGSGPVVVVTSRDSLAGLVARDGARRLDLDLLPAADAVALLRALIGPRVDADPRAASALADACARLPLALRIAAELAAARPASGLAELAAELAVRQDRPALLDAGGDTRTAISSVFSWSYLHLPADAATAFRLLGLHPGADWDRYAAAALTGLAPGRVREQLAVLTRAHLIEPAGGGRHAMHDLLRGYAAGLAASTDSGQRRRGALSRLLDYYVATAAAAMNALDPAGRHRRPDPPAGIDSPEVSEPAVALAWLDGERATLVAISGYAAGHGWPGHTIRLAATLYRYLVGGGHYTEGLAIQAHGLRAARDSGDRSAQAQALTYLGTIYLRQGRYQQAAEQHELALEVAREGGDRRGEARALGNLANTLLRQGRHQQAIASFEQTIALFRELGDPGGEAIGLDNLSAAALSQGRFQQAGRYVRRALELYRTIGDKDGEANALNNLGAVCGREGRLEQAAACHLRALGLHREIGNRQGIAQSTINLGDVCYWQGGYRQAARYHRQALDLYREIGDTDGEAGALNRLGESQLADGCPGEARTSHRTALALSRTTGDQHEQARALAGLGDICHRQGDHRQAARYRRQALDLYREIGGGEGEASLLNSMGEALLADGQPSEARLYHARAHDRARETGNEREQDRARDGLRALSERSCV